MLEHVYPTWIGRIWPRRSTDSPFSPPPRKCSSAAVSNASYTAWMPVAGCSATLISAAVAVVATVTVAVRPGSVVATW